MGFDQTPPRNGLILFFTALSVAVLFLLSFVFKSYFIASSEGEITDKVMNHPWQLREKVNRAQAKLLDQKAVDRAIDRLGKEEREALDVIRPLPVEDTAALVGWAEVPTGWQAPATANSPKAAEQVEEPTEAVETEEGEKDNAKEAEAQPAPSSN